MSRRAPARRQAGGRTLPAPNSPPCPSGRSLNLQWIAEGVENEAQRAWLEQAGVNVAQGFLFARPVPADIFEERYLSHENPDYKS